MKSFWTKTSVLAAALLCTAMARADVVDFENVDTSYAPFAPLLADGDAVIQGNYFVNTQDINGGGGLIAQLSLGSDPGSCLNGTCPGGNATNFLSVYNDGIVHLGRLGNLLTAFGGLSAAYIPTPGNTPGSTVYLAVEADRSDGYYAEFFPLLSNGDFTTIDSSTTGYYLGGSGSLNSYGITDIFVYAYYCDAGTGACGAFRNDRAQFALDDINLNNVPEPASLALALTGLGACGFAARRRRSV